MKGITVAVLYVLTATMFGGCASSHNLRDGESVLDGGYQVTEVNQSIFYIYARTNAAFIARYEDAQRMWSEHAVRSCKGQSFSVAQMSHRLRNSKLPPLVVAEMYGYAICSGSGLTEEQVREAIEKYERGRTS